MEQLSSVLGIPIQSSYVPAVTNVDFNDRMSYGERLRNMLLAGAAQAGFSVIHDAETEVFRKRYG